MRFSSTHTSLSPLPRGTPLGSEIAEGIEETALWINQSTLSNKTKSSVTKVLKRAVEKVKERNPRSDQIAWEIVELVRTYLDQIINSDEHPEIRRL